jgi:hypothetical protein
MKLLYKSIYPPQKDENYIQTSVSYFYIPELPQSLGKTNFIPKCFICYNFDEVILSNKNCDINLIPRINFSYKMKENKEQNQSSTNFFFLVLIRMFSNF